MSESATVRFGRPITAAAGVYAPGHIGELTQYLPFELVDDVLSLTKTVQRRLRVLPSRVGCISCLHSCFPPPWLCAGMAEAHRRIDRSRSAESVGEGVARSAPSSRPGPFQALFEVSLDPWGGRTHPE
jgi:hypothetical protein